MFNTEVSGSLTAEGRLTGNLAVTADQGHRLGQQPAVRQHQRACGEDDLRRPHARPGSRRGRRSLRTRRRRCSRWPAGRSWKRPPAPRGRTRRSASTRTSASSTGRWPPAAMWSCTPITKEVHLQELALKAEGVEWRTEPGSQAAIQYGSDRIGVQDVRLVSGAQRLAVDGAFGGAGDTLKVRAEAVDVASVNTLMLGTQQIGGTLSANATLTGTREAPRADAHVLDRERLLPRVPVPVVRGHDRVRRRRRAARHEALADAGRVDRGEGVRAGGVVQASRSRRRPPPSAADEHIAARPGEELDIAVTSSTLSLGLIQAFVPQVTKVSGTLQADVRVTGARRDPHLSGCDRHPQRGLHRRRTDEERVHGLRHAYHARARSRPAGDSSVCSTSTSTRSASRASSRCTSARSAACRSAIKSDQFEIIDNKLADIKLNSDLRVTGELRRRASRARSASTPAPSTSGEVLALTTNNAYAVEPTKLETERPAPPPAGAPPLPVLPPRRRRRPPVQPTQPRGVHGRETSKPPRLPRSAEPAPAGQHLRRAGARRPALDAQQPRDQGHRSQSVRLLRRSASATSTSRSAETCGRPRSRETRCGCWGR